MSGAWLDLNKRRTGNILTEQVMLGVEKRQYAKVEAFSHKPAVTRFVTSIPVAVPSLCRAMITPFTAFGPQMVSPGKATAAD